MFPHFMIFHGPYTVLPKGILMPKAQSLPTPASPHATATQLHMPPSAAHLWPAGFSVEMVFLMFTLLSSLRLCLNVTFGETRLHSPMLTKQFPWEPVISSNSFTSRYLSQCLSTTFHRYLFSPLWTRHCFKHWGYIVIYKTKSNSFF